jgi:co-chaperonin GroES (HSP10)
MKKKSEFQPLGRWIAVTTDKAKKEKTTDAGIIYSERDSTGQYVKSVIKMVGPGIEERLNVGDVVYWDSKKFTGNEVDGMHIIHESWIAVVVEE